MGERADIASRIDHTLLKAEATRGQVDRLCDEAVEYGFASVCVNPVFIGRAHARLRNTGVKAGTVVGFPLGASMAGAKAEEAAMATRHGADELDIVAHLPHLLAADAEAARAELMEIVYAAREIREGLTLKVIVETALLMHEAETDTIVTRFETACRAVREAGADYIKTSTGFHPLGGATADAVGLLTRHAGMMKVKAAGGIKTYDDARAMLDAGADRLGCSAGIAIVSGAPAE